jgi:tRNA dimethylallyltransferase
MTDQKDHHPDRTECGKPPLIVIVGPTAVGKTRLSLMLAEQFNGEIVNADSRSFYRGMDIGTAKVSPEERERVPHHLIDILDPNDSVSLALFQDMAYASIRDIAVRGKTPFLVGGTPQYVNAVVEGWNMPRVEPDHDLRLHLEREAAEHGFETLLERLRAVDPESAIRTGSNVRRIVRALEVYEKTGRPMSELQSKGPASFQALELELWRPREDLHRRIDERVHAQITGGLFDEIRTLLSRGASPESAAFTSIGYRQAIPYIRSEATADEVAERIRLDTRRLVRHQETWWRKNPRLLRIDMTDPDATSRMQRTVAAHLGDGGRS